MVGDDERIVQALLTPVQYQVLRLLLDGKANKEIGCELGISAQTVKNHLAAIYPRIGVQSAKQAIAWYGLQESSETLSAYEVRLFRRLVRALVTVLYPPDNDEGEKDGDM